MDSCVQDLDRAPTSWYPWAWQHRRGLGLSPLLAVDPTHQSFLPRENRNRAPLASGFRWKIDLLAAIAAPTNPVVSATVVRRLGLCQSL
jgi:hypothetical protein